MTTDWGLQTVEARSVSVWRREVLLHGGSAGRTALPPEALDEDTSCLFWLLGLHLALCLLNLLLFSPCFSD